MRRFTTFSAAFGLVGIGYVLGSVGLPASLLLAQANKGVQAAEEEAGDKSGPSPETAAKIKAADDALKAAMEALQNENASFYVPATKGLNALAITSGGVNAVEDLESGRGVDPETFAALYAGLATDEVAAKLDRDSERRITYNNKLVKMYSISRLKEMFSRRSALAGESDDAKGGKKPAKKPAAEEPEEKE